MNFGCENSFETKLFSGQDLPNWHVPCAGAACVPATPELVITRGLGRNMQIAGVMVRAKQCARRGGTRNTLPNIEHVARTDTLRLYSLH